MILSPSKFIPPNGTAGSIATGILSVPVVKVTLWVSRFAGLLSVTLGVAMLSPSAHAIELRKDIVGSFGSISCGPDMLRGEVYDLPVETRNLPNFEKLKSNGNVVCNNWLNIPTRAFLEGLPGVTTRIEWFAIDYNGDFWVEKPGAYMFTLSSDDGSKLYVDGKNIIDNDGQHAAIELGGRAKLEPGKHHIRVSYFQGPREFVALVLRVAPPGGIFDFFDMRNFRPSATQKGTVEVVLADESRPVLRRSTTAHDPLSAKAFEVSAMTALAASPRPRDFELRAKAYRFHSNVAIAMEVPGSELTATPVDGGRVRLHLVLLALVKDSEGNVLRKISEDFPVDIPADRSLKNSTLRLTRLVTLPEGLYIVQAVAVDRESNRASTATFRLNNPAPAAVGLSDLMLVRRIEPSPTVDPDDPMQTQGRRVVAELAPVIAATAEPSVYFVIHPDTKNLEKPKITIELALDGTVVGKQTSELPAADATGAIPLTIAAPAKPGKNRLRITVQQGTAAVERIVEYAVELR